MDRPKPNPEVRSLSESTMMGQQGAQPFSQRTKGVESPSAQKNRREEDQEKFLASQGLESETLSQRTN